MKPFQDKVRTVLGQTGHVPELSLNSNRQLLALWRTRAAKSEKQRRFMGAELARKKAGQPTKTGMSATKLRHYATKGSKRGSK